MHASLRHNEDPVLSIGRGEYRGTRPSMVGQAEIVSAPRIVKRHAIRARRRVAQVQGRGVRFLEVHHIRLADVGEAVAVVCGQELVMGIQPPPRKRSKKILQMLKIPDYNVVPGIIRIKGYAPP